jgi:hypothetical protein
MEAARTVVVKGRRKALCSGKDNTCDGLATKTTPLCLACKKASAKPTPRSILKEQLEDTIIEFEGSRYVMRAGEVYKVCTGDENKCTKRAVVEGKCKACAAGKPGNIMHANKVEGEVYMKGDRRCRFAGNLMRPLCDAEDNTCGSLAQVDGKCAKHA